jgi:hypothetical protein
MSFFFFYKVREQEGRTITAWGVGTMGGERIWEKGVRR